MPQQGAADYLEWLVNISVCFSRLLADNRNLIEIQNNGTTNVAPPASQVPQQASFEFHSRYGSNQLHFFYIHSISVHIYNLPV